MENQPFDVEGTRSEHENKRRSAIEASPKSQIQQYLHGHAPTRYKRYTFRPSFFEYITVFQSGR